ncbi:uncharacterized protein LOC131265010 [Anopheles coustani]|uniref:uncharacterized protein LOC131265010 n=1 Tax=Anopheles coustani TaxID=139045 RepID=UPI002659208B|nr:uncharacterized protein LOC131265010 [Anopheles coustani]
MDIDRAEGNDGWNERKLSAINKTMTTDFGDLRLMKTKKKQTTKRKQPTRHQEALYNQHQQQQQQQQQQHDDDSYCYQSIRTRRAAAIPTRVATARGKTATSRRTTRTIRAAIAFSAQGLPGAAEEVWTVERP